jgi:hypothetical protein
VVLGRYGDLGGHAWVVVRMNEIEYLIESTEAALDPLDPPIISKVGSRYLPETLFDRHAIYVRANPRETWANRGGDYWSDQIWLRIEPREADPKNDPAVVDALKLNTAAKASSTAEPTAELSKVKLNQPIWKKPLPAAPKVPVKH